MIILYIQNDDRALHIFKRNNKMNEQVLWTGTVPGNLESGRKTGVQLKAGDIISVTASGYINFAAGDTQFADPRSPIPPYGTYPAGVTVLVALIGNNPTKHPIGTGVLDWRVPTDGELILLVDDKPGFFADNVGYFTATVLKHKRALVSSVS